MATSLTCPTTDTLRSHWYRSLLVWLFIYSIVTMPLRVHHSSMEHSSALHYPCYSYPVSILYEWIFASQSGWQCNVFVLSFPHLWILFSWITQFPISKMQASLLTYISFLNTTHPNKCWYDITNTHYKIQI